MAHDGCNGPGVKRSILGYRLYALVNVPRDGSGQWEPVAGTFRVDAMEATTVARHVAAQRPDVAFNLFRCEETLH
jgi:hypothetical protein